MHSTNVTSVLRASATALLCATASIAWTGGPANASALGAHKCDFNNDRYDDQAIGIPSESIGGVIDMGAVHVIYGSASGLSTAGDKLWHQDIAGIESPGELSDRFGEALACGDFNGDDYDDLAVGILSEDTSGGTDAGAVQIICGSAKGLIAAGDQIWHQDSPGIRGAGEGRDRFGSSVAAGDFNGDGFDDLAVGVPVEKVHSDLVLAGAVNVIYGSASGLTGAGDQIFHQDTPGIRGVAEKRDLFGFSLAAGDFNGDNRDDLAIGVPAENVGDLGDAGAVNVIYGSNSGLTTAGDQIFHQNTANVNGVAEKYDQFGYSLAAGDFNGDNRDDLAIGVPGEDVGSLDSAGAVNILFGTSNGLTTDRDQIFTQKTSGVKGDHEAYDRFGYSLAAADFNGDGRDDLAIGVPWESISGIPEVGAVNVLFGAPGGLSVAGNEYWHQNQPSVKGGAEAYDRLAESLSTGDFDGNGRYDLTMGVPGESIAGTSDVGAINVLYGKPGGFDATDDEYWHQGTPGIAGDPEKNDRIAGWLRSHNVYRIPYEDGTDVRVSYDRLTHSPQQDRIDMSGKNAGPDYTIVAARSGTIMKIVDTNSEPTDQNNYVWIKHSNGEWTKYTHFKTGTVVAAGRSEGEQVSTGTELGLEGDVGKASGEHLHFEVGIPYDENDALTGGGFLKGENRDPFICGIPGNTFVAGQTYTAGPC